MDTSNMDKPVRFQVRTTSKDDFGQLLDVWADVYPYEVYASLKPVSSREKMRSGAVDTLFTHTVATRWAPELSPPDATRLRCLYGTRIFNIIGGANVDEDDTYLIFDCVEGNRVGQ